MWLWVQRHHPAVYAAVHKLIYKSPVHAGNGCFAKIGLPLKFTKLLSFEEARRAPSFQRLERALGELLTAVRVLLRHANRRKQLPVLKSLARH
jgi:hypothetical protein